MKRIFRKYIMRYKKEYFLNLMRDKNSENFKE